MIIEERRAKLENVVLLSGKHKESDKMCAMEAVAWLAGESWSDAPACACPVIGSFMRNWNDGISSEKTRTQLLLPLLERIVGTRSSLAVEQKRRWLIVDWEMRTRVPSFLRLLPSLKSHAKALEGMPEIVDINGLIAAREFASAARDAAWYAAGSAAGAAARDAAWYAAGAAAWAAARDAAWYAAGAAAWYAAGSAAWYAAWAAARDAAWYAAGAAAWAAARDAGRDARLAKAVGEMQTSAQHLVIRLCGMQ
jgi:hypothetical protein